ncbi:MAG: hypothetical protein H8E44_29045 [Planctomycetes bacterium]|nr:hypothetical protein [Planctomycetota bacterium]MBL7040782.1 hypothetical protein [Pirellulaceae bacterium]
MQFTMLAIIPLVLIAASSAGSAALTDAQCEAIRGKHTAYGQQLCERTLEDERAGDLQFGLAGLWLNSKTDEANERLRQGLAKVIQNDQMTPEVATRFKWAMRGWLRVYYLFHDRSTFYPGRLAADVQHRLEEMFWNYACAKSSVARAKPEHIWFIQGSENHDMMDLSNAFLALQAVYKLPDFQDRRLPDGHTADEHRQAWNEYYKLYCDERAKGGLFVEISPTYGKYFLPELVNIWEFCEDPVLRKKMEMLLHLTWADWAVEALGGVRGGGKTRSYQGHYSQRGTSDSWSAMGRILTGQGDWFPTQHYEAQYVLATTKYRLPDVVIDIALNPHERSQYVYQSLRPAKLAEAPSETGNDISGYWMDGRHPRMLRYSYCTPDYILGSWMLDPQTDYAAINTQNRWQGMIFATNKNSRVFPQCVGLRNGKTYNQHVAVQHENVMIVQKNRIKSKQVGPMRVFFGRSMKHRLVEQDGWLFLQEGDACLAVCILPRDNNEDTDGYAWEDGWLVPADDLAPIVFVAGRRERFPSQERFIAYVRQHSITCTADMVQYAFENSLEQTTTLTLYADGHKLPEVNGSRINLAPQKVYDCPYLKADHRRGLITIQKAPRKMTLDFERNLIIKEDL